MDVKRKKIFWLDIIFFVVLLALGAYFFYKSAPAANAPENGDNVTSMSEVNTDLPEGVTVENLNNGGRLVKNERDGYEVKISSGEYVYKDFEGDLKIQNYIEPNKPYGGSAGCSVYFSKSEKKDENEIKQKFQNNCTEIIGADCKSTNVEKVEYNGNNWIRFYLSGSFVGTNNPTFVTYDGDFMYTLSFPCVDESFISSILNNFSF